MAVDAQRVQAIFLAAIEVEMDKRVALLDRECAGDIELRRRVEALLQAHQQPASILDQPVAAARPESDADPFSSTRAIEPSGNRLSANEDAITSDDRTATGDAPAALEFLSPSTKPGSLGRLGHYEVLEVLGEGGFGIVVRAFDEKLHRVVAIKIMSPQLAATSPARKRFLREARAAAKVRHENVVQIYAVEEQPIPYLVMEYIPGRTLQQKLDNDGPLEPTEMLRLAGQITRGLAAAHAQDLIHRDIKPGNILLEEAIEPHVKITDFGLARAADDASLTQSGTVAGTPMYMSPEQANGQSLDARSDLFSLGSVFYVMLSGRPPFRASGTIAVLKRVCEDIPRPIRDVIPEAPEWLCDVISKLHAKKPEERFQTATEVVEVISKQQVPPAPAAGSVIPARPRRIALGSRRGLAGKLLAAAGVLLLLVAGTWTTIYMMRRPVRIPPQDDKVVVQGTDEYFDALKRENIHPNLLALAGGGDPEQAPPELVAVLGDGRFILPRNGPAQWMAQTADGKVLAVPRGNMIVLFEAESGNLLRVLSGHASRIGSMAFSHDGKRLAAGNFDDDTIRVWHVDSGELAAAFSGKGAGMNRLAFSPDGKRMVVGHNKGALKVLDAETGNQVLDLAGHQDSIPSVVYSPDGKRIVSASKDRTVKVWNANDGVLMTTLATGQGELRLAFSPNAKLLACGCATDLKVWDATTLNSVHELNEPAEWLAFTSDSRFLLAGKHLYSDRGEHAVTRWNLEKGTRETTLPLKSRGEWAIPHLSQDGKTLFCMNADPPDPYVRTYDAETGKELFPRQGHEGQVHTVAISPDGRMLASGGADHKVRLWDLAKWQPGHANPPVRLLDQQHTGEVWSVAFSPDGKLLASGSLDSTIVLWEVASGKVLRTLIGHSGTSSILAFSPDGQTIAAGLEDGNLKFWDVATGKPNDLPRRHSKWVRAVAFSPDGKFLACAATDKTVQVCELATGRSIHKFQIPGEGWFLNVAFSPDGKKLAAGSGWPESTLRVWDLDTKKVTTFVGHSNHVHGLHFHPEGHLVATAGHDGTVRFWDHAAGSSRVLTIGPGPFGSKVDQVAFSPKGGYLATANDNGTISILRVPQPPPAYTPGAPQKLPDPLELAKRPSPADALKRENIPPDLLAKAATAAGGAAPPELVAILGGKDGHDGPVTSVAISPDGKTLASGGNDKTIRLWDLATAQLRKTLPGHGDHVRTLTFSPDGSILASGSNDGIIKLWDAARGGEPRTLSSHGGVVSQVSFAPDGKLLASASTDSTLKLWDVNTGRLLNTFRVGKQLLCLAFSPDGKTLASGEYDPGCVRLWDVATGWQTVLPEVRTSVRHVAFQPDGRTLTSSGEDGKIHLWDLATLQEKPVLKGHDGMVLSFAWRGDGRLLASCGGNDGTVRLWYMTATPTSSKELRLFPPFPPQAGSFIPDMAMTPEGRHLAIANPDGTVYVLRLAERGVVYQAPRDIKD